MDARVPATDKPTTEKNLTPTIRGFRSDSTAQPTDRKVGEQTPPQSTPTTIDRGDGVPITLTDVPGYDVHEFIGRGANAMVYRATQQELHRTVALKFLMSQNHRDVARFRAEAGAVAKLHHPNIVQIHEIGDHFGYPFLALEYVTGGQLSSLMAQKPMDPREAARLCRIAANAIHYAHTQGIVHRDLKPSNILLDQRKELKIVDFGIAKLQLEDQSFTQDGEIIGTPAYMSPEQARGETAKIGPSTDVFALGVIMYEMLTGSRPFISHSAAETLHKVMSDDPIRPSRMQRTIPADIETICLKCLEKEPNRRYGTALELAEDLRRYLDHEPIRARQISAVARLGKWAKRRPAVAALSVIALVATISAITGLGLALASANQLVVSEKKAGERQTELRQETEVALKETQTAQAALEKSSRETEVALYSSRIAQADLMAEKGVFRGAAMLLEQCKPKQSQQDLRGWEWNYVNRLLNADTGRFYCDFWVLKVAYSPDGRYLGAACGNPGTLKDNAEQVKVPGTLWIFNSGKPTVKHELNPHAGAVNDVQFSPDSKKVLSRSTVGTTAISDVETGKPIGGPFTLNSQVQFVAGGSRAVEMEPNGAIHLWSLQDGKKIAVLRKGGEGTTVIGLPDRETFAFDLRNEIKLMSATTNKVIRTVSAPPAAKLQLIGFSANGDRFCYVRDNHLLNVLNVQTLQSSFENETNSKGLAHVQLSPTGKYLCYCPNERDITVVELVNPTRNQSLQNYPLITFSENEEYFTASYFRGAFELFHLPSFQRELNTSYSMETGLLDAKLSSSSNLFAWCGHDGKIVIWDCKSKERKAVLEGHDGAVRSLAFFPDGKWIASAGADATLRVWDLDKQARVERVTNNSIQDGVFVGQVWIDPKGENIYQLYHHPPMLRKIDRATGKTLDRRVDVSSAQSFPRGDSAVSRTHNLLFAAKESDVNSLTLIDPVTAKEIRAFRGHTTRLQRVGISENAKYAASFAMSPMLNGEMKREFIVWDATTGQKVLSQVPKHFISSLAFSQDGSKLALFSMDQAQVGKTDKMEVQMFLEVISIPDGRSQLTWKSERAKQPSNWFPPIVIGSGISPDGKVLVGAEFESGKVHVWDLETKEKRFAGKPIFAQKCATSVAFNPAGDRVAIHTYLGVISLWNPQSGERMITLQTSQSAARPDDVGFSGKVMFSADGNLLVANNWMGTIDLWDGTPKSSFPAGPLSQPDNKEVYQQP